VETQQVGHDHGIPITTARRMRRSAEVD
jgi:hypothetical protein